MPAPTISANGSMNARRRFLAALSLALSLAAAPDPAVAVGAYPWREPQSQIRSLESAFPPPAGFVRQAVQPDSFAAWLRGLPLKPDGAKVMLYSGAEKARQDVHAGVIDIDVGSRDLQQCADAVMRLRAEWLFAARKHDDIAFTVTEGGRVPFSRWAYGERPNASGKTWKRIAKLDRSYWNFRKYMDFIYSYAGTASLEKELVSVEPRDLAIGDVFIKGGFPGHAVLVADVAVNVTTSAKRFLLIQSYMPAQDMHVLKNLANGDGSPWYAMPVGDLVTPEWTFAAGSLKRWP